MSDRPPPPLPSGFWQPAEDSSSTQQQSYNNAPYAHHQLPPPPPPAQGQSTVPPPLYGYNPATHYSHLTAPHARNSGGATREAKRRRLEHQNNTETPWHCQVCQVFLESQTALQAHRNAHVKCPQCSFTASRKVVNGHYASAHGKFAGGGFKTVTVAIPGCKIQRFNICVGNHPDDVKKWIQERKKRFPRQQTKDSQGASKRKGKEEVESSALSSLLDGYGSSSSEGEGENDGKPTVAIQESQSAESKMPESTRPPNYRTRPCKYFMRNGSCRNGDACNFIHDHESRQQALQRPNNATRPNKRQQKGSTTSTTLLLKLLENDARREAALSIQLLEYLVDCNYLQKQRSGDEASSGATK